MPYTGREHTILHQRCPESMWESTGAGKSVHALEAIVENSSGDVVHVFHLLCALSRDVRSPTQQATNVHYVPKAPLYQGRFFSCPMDDPHMWATVRYIERNPVRARIVEQAEDYPWSSAAAHCGLREDDLLSEGFPPGGVIADWSAWLREEDDKDMIKTIRRHTKIGWPCGGKEFVDRLERMLGRPLRPQKRGPKAKWNK